MRRDWEDFGGAYEERNPKDDDQIDRVLEHADDDREENR